MKDFDLSQIKKVEFFNVSVSLTTFRDFLQASD